MELSPLQVQYIQQWNEAHAQLQKWRVQESDLRDLVVKYLFAPDGQQEGTEKLVLGNQWVLKLTKRLNYKLNNELGEVAALCASLPDSLSKQLVRWKPELSLSTYRKLDPVTKERFHGILTIEFAKPSLELIPPDND